MCRMALLAEIEDLVGNGVDLNYAAVDVAVGSTFIMRCPVSYRVAPDNDLTTTTQDITITCQPDQTFTRPTERCVCTSTHIFTSNLFHNLHIQVLKAVQLLSDCYPTCMSDMIGYNMIL